MTYKPATMTNKNLSHSGSFGLSAGSLMAKLRNMVKIEIPVGYQDESGFHYGVKAVEKQADMPVVG